MVVGEMPNLDPTALTIYAAYPYEESPVYCLRTMRPRLPWPVPNWGALQGDYAGDGVNES